MSKQAELANGSMEALLGQVADEFTDRINRGERPDVEDYAERYPEMAAILRQVLPALQVMGPCSLPVEPSGAQVGSEVPVSGCLGDFRLIREVGRGGMGIVYEAEQISLGRRVALKVLPFAATMDARQLQRFQNEARAAAGLHHTNIVPVYFVGCERGVHYYAMQFIAGRDLASLVAQFRAQADRKAPTPEATATVAAAEGVPVAPAALAAADTRPIAGLVTEGSLKSLEYFRSVARLGMQAAEALDHAHQLGIVHRDVKPANLLVDSAGQLWVTDFGLAQVQSDTRLTMSGDLVGTLRYMSPEQALAKRVVVDHRTDIYSLGATLYELLTLEPVFAGRDRQELLRQIAFDEPRRPRQWNRAIPRELETIVLKALEKNPAERYPTAQELAADLRNYLEDRPIRAQRPSLRQRAMKWARRHRAVVWASAVALVVIVAALTGMIAWAVRDRESRAAEARQDQQARERETAHAVQAELDETKRLQNERRLPEALTKAKQAREVLASGTGTPELEGRVQARLADLEMIAGLEMIRSQRRGPFGIPQDSAKYVQAFRSFGIDVGVLSPEEAAGRIRKRSVAVELAAGLDDWAFITLHHRGGEKRWKWLLTTAQGVDPEPLRSKVRQLFLDGSKPKEVEKALTGVLAQTRVEQMTPTTIVTLAHACYIHGPLEDTLRLLQQAQQRYPDDFWVHWELGFLMRVLRPNDKEEFFRCFTTAAALRPNDADTRWLLGIMLEERGSLDDAIIAYQEAVRLDPGHTRARQSLVAALLVRGPSDQDIAQLREAARLKPKDFQALDALGEALLRREQSDEAILAFQQAINLNPPKELLKQAHASLGAAHLMKGNPDGAIKELQMALAVQEDPATQLLLGEALKKKGRVAEAIEAMRKAIALDPKLAVAHNSLAWLLATTPEQKFRDPEQAVKSAGEAVVLDRANRDFRNTLGVAFYRKGEWKKAVGTLRQSMMRWDGGSSADFFFLAMAHWRLLEKEQAIIWYGKGVEWMQKNKPKDAELLRFRAEAAELLGIKDADPQPRKQPMPRN